MVDVGIISVDILNGLSRGMLFFLMTSGLALTFSVMGIINMAHGSFIMLGAYLTFTFLLPQPITPIFIGAILSGAILVGVIGSLIERFLLRRIYDAEHLYQLLLTFALVLIVDGLVIQFWGGQPRSINFPDYLMGAAEIGGISFPKFSLFTLIVSSLVTLGLWVFLYKTNFGKAARAASMDREITESLGINVPLVYAGMFSLGAALAGFAGGMGFALSSLTPGIGSEFIILCFAIVVIGGVGSLWGTFIAALILGMFESFGDHYFPQMAMALPYMLMALILILKPQGLLGKG